jgi:transposase
MFLGIDVSKLNLAVAVLLANGKYRTKTVTNNQAGFEALWCWLARFDSLPDHVCLEATGPYGEDVACFLHDRGLVVSIANPARIKGYAKSEGLRTKTDKVDARLIARFCKDKKEDLHRWIPAAVEHRELRDLTRRLEALKNMRVQEENRLEGKLSDVVAANLTEHIQYLDKQIRQLEKAIKDHIDRNPDLRQQCNLLKTIPGIAETTSANLISELCFDQFSTARQAAAYAGLTPSDWESGTSVKGRPRLSKIGNRRLRKMLYMPAIAAIRYNPTLAEFADRLERKGKKGKVIISAVMRKMIHIAFGVLKSGRPFDPKYQPSFS